MKTFFLLSCLIVFGVGVTPSLLGNPQGSSIGQPISPLDGSRMAVMKEGEKLWDDKDYVATDWPDPLKDLVFVQSSMTTCKVELQERGFLIVVTPVHGQRGGFSEEASLRAAGFARADIETFLPFQGADRDGDTCCVYQKKVIPGDTYERAYRYGITLWRSNPLPLAGVRKLQLEPVNTAMETHGFKLAIMERDAKLWSDKEYRATEWPAPLLGRTFVRSSMDSCKITAKKEGYLLVVTPTEGQRGGFSEEPTLRKTGFKRVEVDTFLPFIGADTSGDTCCVYQRKMNPGDDYHRKYKYGVTLWSASPLPLAKDKTPAPSSTAGLRITPNGPPNEGILFVDHSKSNRSGHLGHALVEYEQEKILAFYPNCSADHGGHSAVGWMEFKRSQDGGKTWGSPQVLQFSKELFLKKEGRTAMAEKAVLTGQGEIILFYLICDISENALWQPYWTPLFSRSADGGKTWSDPEPVCPSRGRIYDAVYQDGEIRVLHFANDATVDWTGTTDEHLYELYVSNDEGKTFMKRSTLPMMTKHRGYGSLGRLENGGLIAYVYNRTNEYVLDYVISADGGRTWSGVNTSRFSRKIRNPQFIAFDGKFYMHGRSGAYGEGKGNLILYMSLDGVTWDNGVYLRTLEAGAGAYSNSIVVGSKNAQIQNRLLIQASHAYEDNKTNVLHWWLDRSKESTRSAANGITSQ